MNLNVTLTELEKLLRALLGKNIELFTFVGPGEACVETDPEQVQSPGHAPCCPSAHLDVAELTRAHSDLVNVGDSLT